MDQAIELSAAVARIYDAALNSDVWPEALEATCSFCDMQCAGLGIVDLLGPAFSMVSQWGYEPAVFARYLDTYVHENPLMAAAAHHPVGAVSLLEDIIAPEAFRATRFYKEWAGPAGFLDAAHAWLDKNAGGGASCVLVRDVRKGPVSRSAVQRFELLVPHLRRAVLIGRLLETQKTDVFRLTEVLDALAAGVFVSGATGELIHANRTARRLLDARDGFQLVSGRLKFTDTTAQQRLTAVLAAASVGGVDEGGQLLAIRRRTAAPLAAHILPLRTGRGIDGDAVAAIFVRTVEFDTERAVTAMGDLYCLTVAEQKVVRAIATGEGVRNAATRLGIREATARTHLAHVFQKTGARTQAEIVRMLGGYGGPIG